jgi:hypothetical protein
VNLSGFASIILFFLLIDFFLFCSFTFELLETKHCIFFQFIFYEVILIS